MNMTYDRDWVLRAATGDITGPAAWESVVTSRYVGKEKLAARDRQLFEAIEEGDKRHPEDYRRWPDGRVGWWPSRNEVAGIVPDPETHAAWDQISQNSQNSQGDIPWPVLGEDAYYGVAGEIVRYLDPHTEADPAAVLVSLLTAFGVMAGDSSYMKAGGVKHPARLFVTIVGKTAKARKGTSWAAAKEVLEYLDKVFLRARVQGGFGSGEILVDAVANREEEDSDSSDSGASRDSEKRLLIYEPEFASVLKVCGQREGSTLSQILRAAWDGERLQARSRGGGTVVADDAHIGVLGHITLEELRRMLTATEIAGGFANRFMLVAAKKSKSLPLGGDPDDAVLAAYGRQLGDLAQLAYLSQRRIGFTPAGEALWCQLYEQMDEDDPGGLVGSMIARDQPYVLRLGLIYCLLDGSDKVDEDHLRAAWAVWSYCRASTHYMFGDALGDEVADKLLEAVRERTCPRCEIDRCCGLSLTDQSKLFGKHKEKERLAEARSLLEAKGLVETVLLRNDDGSRAPRVTFAVWRRPDPYGANSANSAKSGFTESAEPADPPTHSAIPPAVDYFDVDETPPLEAYTEPADAQELIEAFDGEAYARNLNPGSGTPLDEMDQF